MSLPDLSDLLQESSEILYNTPYFSNIGEDKDGRIVESLNNSLGKEYWILPGYFNTIMKERKIDGTPKVSRNVDIPSGKKIFCMVASSHATRFEAGKLNAGTAAGSLQSIAERIDRLWTEIRLTYDGVRQPLRRVMTRVFDVTIPGPAKNPNPPFNTKDHPYVKYGEDQGVQPGPTPMLSIGHVAILSDHDGGIHTLDMYAASNGDADLGEPAYESDVRYNIS